MAQIQTVRGPIDSAQLGTSLMHEHVNNCCFRSAVSISRLQRFQDSLTLTWGVAPGYYISRLWR
jgi:predicted metal-dependent phosphotriesterase family hydrolase